MFWKVGSLLRPRLLQLKNNTYVNIKGISQLSITSDDFLEFKNKNCEIERFPLLWLRDNCLCKNCFHPSSQSRIINWNNFNENIEVKYCKTENNCIEIEWSDGHSSSFNYDWLMSRSFNAQKQETFIKEIFFQEKSIWGKKQFDNIKGTSDFKKIMNNDGELYNWLKQLNKYGVAFLENTPRESIQCEDLCNKIGLVRRTHYGKTFEVKHKEKANNVAYLSGFLQLHTDLPYYNYVPGVTVLLCITPATSEGGENILTDVHYVIKQLRDDNKEEYKILTETEIIWSDIGEENGNKFHKIHKSPMISVDKMGNILSVRHSIPQRDSHFTIKLQNANLWYRALKLFIKMINNESIYIKLKAGEILAFDNTRIVHGRTSYNDSCNKPRLIVGDCIDWDEIYSRMRVLQKSA